MTTNNVIEKEYLTCNEVSLMTSIPQYTIRKLTREGRLPAYKLEGTSILYNRNDINNLIKKNRIVN